MAKTRTRQTPAAVEAEGKFVRFRSWLAQSKPTEWLTVVAAVTGLTVAYQAGVFDAHRANLSAQNERLTMEKFRLETRKEKLDQEIHLSKNALEEATKKLDVTTTRLKLFEEELAAIKRMKKEAQQSYERTKILVDADIGLTYDVDGYTLRLGARKPTSWAGAPETPDSYPESYQGFDKILSDVGAIRRLKELRLGSFLLTSNQIKSIILNKELSCLILHAAGLTNEQLELLIDSQELKSLGLSFNRITAIPHSLFLPKLNSLSLAHNPIEDDGLKSLSLAAPMLEVLNLRGTKISNKGVAYLKSLKHLGEIDLRLTKITGEAILDLLDAVPGLMIIKIEDHQVSKEIRDAINRKKPLNLMGPDKSGLPNPDIDWYNHVYMKI